MRVVKSVWEFGRRVVRDVKRTFGCPIVYTRSNGYFRQDEFDGPEWQFGADYYQLQCLYRDIEKDRRVLTKTEVMELITRCCGLMHRAAYVRASYNSAMDVINGDAEFRDE